MLDATVNWELDSFKQAISFLVSLRLISSGLEPVLSHTAKIMFSIVLYPVFYDYKVFNHKIKTSFLPGISGQIKQFRLIWSAVYEILQTFEPNIQQLLLYVGYIFCIYMPVPTYVLILKLQRIQVSLKILNYAKWTRFLLLIVFIFFHSLFS